MDSIKEDNVIEVTGLSKKYGKNMVVNNASFTLKKGKIYGFIGQNGAGKTTVIRMIAGYARPDSGCVKMFGDDSPKGLLNGRKRIGAIVENPALYLRMNAYENLKIQKQLYNVKTQGLEEELIKLVGLSGVGKRKVKDFSLGMRQRLGIAMSLVNNPEVLILDEPINGLDPMGIMEVRNLLIKLNREKEITILISSHILSELYQLATDYIIINKGTIVDTFTLEELDKRCRGYVAIKPDNMEEAVEFLEKEALIYSVGENGYITVPDITDVREFAKRLMDNKILLTHFSAETETLESYFIKLIGGAQ